MAKKKNIVEKPKKPILPRLLFLQIGLIGSWYAGQKNMISPIMVGLLILTFTAGIFYTIYQRIPAAKNIFLMTYLFILMTMVWLYILPSFS